MFAVCPEMIVSLLFTAFLADNEVMMINGARQYRYTYFDFTTHQTANTKDTVKHWNSMEIMMTQHNGTK